MSDQSPPLSAAAISAAGGALDSSVRSRVRNWARAFQIRGVQPFAPAMASPPTITKSAGNTSSVNASYVNNAVQYNGQSGVFTWLGGQFVATTVAGGIPTYTDQKITLSDASKAASGVNRVKFLTDSPQIDCNLVEGQGLQFNVLVDGVLAYRSKPVAPSNSGNCRWWKIDFGTNTFTYACDMTLAPPTAGGSGHAQNDVITFPNGLVCRVTNVTGGVINNMTVQSPESFSTSTPGVLSQVSTTGTGTGATVNPLFLARRNTTRTLREIELIFTAGSQFLGVVLATGATILPALVNNAMPKVVFVGDSITEGTYLAYTGGHLASNIAQRLGWWEQHQISAQGGTGWNIANGTSQAWSATSRKADFIAQAADIYVFMGSQNDTAGAALQSSVTATLSAIQTALPNALCVGIGNIMGDSTTLCASIAAGWADASLDQTRLRFINNHSPNKWFPSATYTGDYGTVSDFNHPSNAGIEVFSGLAAYNIANAVQAMVL